MTTADDFVIQFIQDKALVPAATVAEVRASLGELPAGSPVDTLVLDKLVLENKVTWKAITAALGQEFDMEVVDLSQVVPSEELLKLVCRDLAERHQARGAAGCRGARKRNALDIGHAAACLLVQVASQPARRRTAVVEASGFLGRLWFGVCMKGGLPRFGMRTSWRRRSLRMRCWGGWIVTTCW